MKVLISIIFVFVFSVSYAQDGKSFNSSQTLDYINKSLLEHPSHSENGGTKEEHYQIGISGNYLVIYKYETDFTDKTYSFCTKVEFTLSENIRFETSTKFNGYATTIYVFGKFRSGSGTCKDDLSSNVMRTSNSWFFVTGCAVAVSECTFVQSLYNSLKHLLVELEKDGKYKPVVASDPFNYGK